MNALVEMVLLKKLYNLVIRIGCLASLQSEAGQRNSLLGDDSEREPPDPIPNSEVKTFSADDSVDCPCESRTLPSS